MWHSVKKNGVSASPPMRAEPVVSRALVLLLADMVEADLRRRSELSPVGVESSEEVAP